MDIEQAYLKIINPAVKRNDPIYGAVKVANFIWGGSDFSSRLMKRVRVKEGLSYSVNSVVNFGIPLNGDIIAPYSVISCETELNKARKAFDAILEEKTKVLRDGFEKKELEHAIQFFKGSIPLLVESYAQLLSMITEEIIYGLPYFHWEEELRAIEKLTIDEVNKGAQVLLSFESPFVLIVGKAKKLKNQFKDFDIEIIEPEKYL
jgi:zinc protease